MGTMEKIRQTSPFILAVIAVLFIGFMVISDMDLGSVMSRSDQATMAIGRVNGEEIRYADFEKRVQDAIENQRQQAGPDADIDDEPIRQQVWNMMVEEILLRQQADQLGINVTDAELREILLENPPEYLRRNFTDSTGQFNRATYLDVMTNPSSLTTKYGIPAEQAAQFQASILQVEDALRLNRLQEKLQTAVTASMAALPPSYLQRQYTVENSTADVKYVAVSIAAIPDAEVPVSDDEIAKYYEKNKEYYKQKPSRQLKYIMFRLGPSSHDSATANSKIEKLSKALQTAASQTQQDSIFDNYMMDYNGQAHDFTLVKDLDPMKYAYLSAAADHQVLGPVGLSDGAYFLRVDGRRSGENVVVKAGHILIKFGDNKDSAKAEATRIMGLAQGGENFATLAAQYSADPGSAQRGGDLGYFGKGQMVAPFEEAAFAAEPGAIVGPVESQFGYHIIKVEDKKSEELKFSEIRIAPLMSTATKNSQRADALEIKKQLEDGMSLDTIAAKKGLTVNKTGFFPRVNPVLGSVALTLFAFEGDVGDVSTPVEIKREGLVIAQISDIRTEGTKPLEDMKEEIRARLIRQKKLDKAKTKAEELRRKIAAAGSLEAAQAMDSTLNVQIATVKNNGQVTALGQEPAFTNAAFTLQKNTVSEPIRGERNYFVMEVTNRNEADMAQFDAKRQELYQSQLTRLQSSAFYRWLNTIKEKSDIEDKRLEVYRM